MKTIEKIKYRVEEHYENADSYLLHGIYNKRESAYNKIQKLKKQGIKTSNLYVVKIKTIEMIEVFGVL